MPIAMKSLLGERIESLAGSKGMTLEQLAEKSGVHKSQVGRIVRGETKSPRRDTIEAMASVLEIPVSYLLGDAMTKEDPIIAEIRALLAEMDTAKKERVLEFAAFEYSRPLVGDELALR